MFYPPLHLIAAGASDFALIGTAIGSVGALLVGLAALLTRGDAVKKAKVDYHEQTINALQTHMQTLAAENDSFRNRVDLLEAKVNKCQEDKFEMQRQLNEWERKWEEKINEGHAGTT